MSRPVVVDTGPLYAAIDASDQFHARSQSELGRLVRDHRELILAYPTLLEAYTLVLQRLGRSASRWLKEVMLGAALLNPTVEDYREAIEKAGAFPGQQITLVDATLAVLAARMGAEVWTFDHHFDVMRVRVWR